MAKKKQKKEFDPVYSYIEVNKTKRTAVILATTMMFIINAIVMIGFLSKGYPWFLVAMISMSLCLPLIFLPTEEEWIYHPWQKQAQRLELHHYGDN